MVEKIAEIMEKVIEGSSTYEGNNLFDTGMLDSFRIVDLVMELENAFAIEIDAKYITKDNFKTKEAIAALVNKLQSDEEKTKL